MEDMGMLGDGVLVDLGLLTMLSFLLHFPGFVSWTIADGSVICRMSWKGSFIG